ncbi:hypothetical protein HYX10_03625 [Candidatus Woesearchaeota archaeon]|nr:hypothetical protein [Candidatus Woesearchaeota archaeon]
MNNPNLYMLSMGGESYPIDKVEDEGRGVTIIRDDSRSSIQISDLTAILAHGENIRNHVIAAVGLTWAYFLSDLNEQMYREEKIAVLVTPPSRNILVDIYSAVYFPLSQDQYKTI